MTGDILPGPTRYANLRAAAEQDYELAVEQFAEACRSDAPDCSDRLRAARRRKREAFRRVQAVSRLRYAT